MGTEEKLIEVWSRKCEEDRDRRTQKLVKEKRKELG